ncbi:hypothetical protein PSTT_14123 [Puccinia striiformis]|uniref:Uncharacterized protein n=1 Tax=Puccinia striiformis TaxID=27350 RepID=A0A2S4UNT2_9BASI|nr:hypothetical protein PSTT_14123 [Puccinia striiformis]
MKVLRKRLKDAPILKLIVIPLAMKVIRKRHWQ